MILSAKYQSLTIIIYSQSSTNDDHMFRKQFKTSIIHQGSLQFTMVAPPTDAAQRLARLFQEHFTERRYQWLKEIPFPRANTVLVRHRPRGTCPAGRIWSHHPRLPASRSAGVGSQPHGRSELPTKVVVCKHLGGPVSG